MCARWLPPFSQAFYLSENYEQALKHYQECLRREPDHVPAQTELKKVTIWRCLHRCFSVAYSAVRLRWLLLAGQGD